MSEGIRPPEQRRGILNNLAPADRGPVIENEGEKTLRMLLWLNHGHDGLYGDDGEMQCSRCGLDFKSDTVEEINKAFALRSLGEMQQRAIAQERRGYEAWKEDAKDS